MMKRGLSGNALKLIALLTMTVDHIGYILFPSVLWLRIVGRLAFPIYAFLIAEGCRHTKRLGNYFITMAGFALFCQVVSFLATGSLYQCILVTFTLSIGIYWLFALGRTKTLPVQVALLFLGLAAAYFLTELLHGPHPETSGKQTDTQTHCSHQCNQFLHILISFKIFTQIIPLPLLCR
jgi:hypothetical protein